MLDVPADVPALWLGLAVASAALFGLVTALPATAPPDAARAADAVDSVAAGDAPASATVPVPAATAKVGRHRVTLQNAAGTSAAAFAFGPVTAVPPDSKLDRVLDGGDPAAAFASPRGFRRAVAEARGDSGAWRPATRLVVRRVSWGGYTVTLVGVR